MIRSSSGQVTIVLPGFPSWSLHIPETVKKGAWFHNLQIGTTSLSYQKTPRSDKMQPQYGRILCQPPRFWREILYKRWSPNKRQSIDKATSRNQYLLTSVLLAALEEALARQATPQYLNARLRLTCKRAQTMEFLIQKSTAQFSKFEAEQRWSCRLCANFSLGSFQHVYQAGEHINPIHVIETASYLSSSPCIECTSFIATPSDQPTTWLLTRESYLDRTSSLSSSPYLKCANLLEPIIIIWVRTHKNTPQHP